MQEKFHYNTVGEVRDKAVELNVKVPMANGTEVLKQHLTIHGKEVANRIAIQPMEGCDGTIDGSPDELTMRRYDRFSRSGAGIIWVEAVSILQEGRANARQLMLTEANLSKFQELNHKIRETSMKEFGYAPVLIMQATHSGRYSKPEGKPAPMIAYHNSILEKDKPVADDRIVTDDYLKKLEECYAQASRLAEKAGFDGVDIKACHRYLLSELLSAYERPGEYGGSFENRTRLYRNAVLASQAAVGKDTFITSRLNIYDGFPYPNGFGVEEGKGTEPCMEEPIRLMKMLHEDLSMELADCTIGNPYFNPHVNRPFDQGPYEAPEHPLQGVARMCGCIDSVKRAVPNMKIICSGLSYLRQFSGNLAAGMIESGSADIGGFGRMAFAYPEFARDILETGAMDSKKCCITCSKCSELMRASSTAGCVIRDSAYLPIYRKAVLENEKDIAHEVSGM